MKHYVGLVCILFQVTQMVFGAACCGGGGAKSFISLQELQSYEVGLLSSARDVYGRYSLYGEPEEADRNQTISVSFGAGARLLPEADAFLIVPVNLQMNGLGSSANRRAGLGDALIGGRFLVLRSLWQGDWYPTIYLVGGWKVPSGTLETFSEGRYRPGTGNGLWEPFVGVSLRKEYAFATLTFDSTYTGRLPASRAGRLDEGDKIELTEGILIPFTRQFSLGGGSAQSWYLDSSLEGRELANSNGRAVSLFVNGTYFFSQFWSLTAAFEGSPSVAGLGINQPLSRSISVSTRYGFY